MSTRSLQACLDEIPYAGWLGVTAAGDGALRFTLVGDSGNLAVQPQLHEHTTRYVGSSPITKPLTIEVQVVKLGRRIGFVTAEARHVPDGAAFSGGVLVATAQASFAGTG